MVDEAKIKVTADASGVAAGASQAKASIGDLRAYLASVTADMKSQFGDQLRASIEASGHSIDEFNAKLKEMSSAQVAELKDRVEQVAGSFKMAQAETERESLSLREMAASAHEGLEAIEGIKTAILGFGELLLAAFAFDEIKEFAESIGESAEKVKHLSDEFGLSIPQVEELQGVALGTGTSIDTLTRGMAILDKNTQTMSGSASSVGKALAIVGVSANDGRTQMERLKQVADKFGELASGPERLALSMELFGRNGKEMLPILELGSKGIEELSEKSDQLGAVNEAATEKGLKLAEALNTNKIAWEGVKNTLTDAFASILTDLADGFDNLVQEMVASYNSGGAVREIFDGIKIAAGLLGNVIMILADVVKTLYDHMNLIIPIIGAFAAVVAGRYVAGIAAAILETTAFRTVLGALLLQFEAGSVVAAFTALIEGLAAGMVSLAAATAEATLALLASPWTWLAVVVAGAIYLYEKFTEKTREQITADHDLADAKDKLAAAQGDLTKMSKDALEAMKAEDEVALNLAKAHLTAASAALEQAKAEATLAQKRFENQQKTIAPPDVVGGDIAGPSITYSADANAANAKVRAQTDAYKEQKQAVDTLQASIDKLNDAIKKAPDVKPPALDLSSGHDKKAKQPKSRVSEWEEGLAEKKLALQEEDEADDSFREMSKAEEAAYWKNILDTVKLSHEEMIAVKTKYYEASFAARKSDFDDHIATLKRELEAAKGNMPEMQKIADEIVAAYKKAYGDKSKQAQDAERQITEIMRRGADEQARIEEELFRHIAEMQRGRIDDAQNQAQFLNQMGLITNAQLIQEEREFENQRYQIDREALSKKLALLQADPTRNVAQIRATNSQIEQLDQQHQLKLNENTRKAVLERSKFERDAINSTAQLWSQNFAKLLTFQQSFASTIRNLYVGMVGIVSDALAQILEKWLVQHLTTLLLGTAATKTSTAAQIASAAALAGANGTASYAMAPWPIDMGAPAFGAAMSASALAYQGLNSAAGGWFDVPYDGALTELHKNEMVLPAWAAQPLRMMLGGGNANSNAPVAANDGSSAGGGFHYHDHSDRGLTPAQIIANRDAFAKAMKMAHREGKLGFALPA